MSIDSGTLILPRMRTDDPDGCVACAERVAEQLRAIAGVTAVEVIEAPARLNYHFDASSLTREKVESTATNLLSDVDHRFTHHALAIEGMDCDSCARTLERGIQRLPGIGHASVNFGSARLELAYDQSSVSLDNISKRVSDLGYTVATPDAAHEAEGAALLRLLRRRDNLLALLAAVFTLAGIIAWAIGLPAWASDAGYLAAIVVGGTPLAIKGFQALRATRSLDINLLMTIAVIGALAIGEWIEGAAVVTLFSLGEALEGYAMDRARRSIRSLMALAPATALVRRNGQEVELPVADVIPGDVVTVRPGERIPVDGTVSAGASSVDQAALTGESVPVHKSAGDPLFAGTMNGNGPLTMQVTRLASDSSVARIIRLVEQAQGQRAPAQRLVDRFARVYTPAVIAIAVLVATVPPLLVGNAGEWFYRALVLLVISCPCALVISTPVSIVSALSAAARRGILIKGGAALERAGAITTIAFDKTGTLTTGKPAVSAVHAFGATEDDILALAASLEAHSEHPLGLAIREAARSRSLPLKEPSNETIVPGFGLRAEVAGVPYLAGSVRLFAEVPRTAAVDTAIHEVEAAGATAVLVGTSEGVLGVIGVSDTPRPEAAGVLERLHNLGVERLVMLSGDRAPAAERVAQAIGIDDVRAELLPEHKLDAVTKLRASDRVVAMVGDGVNDAPSLAAADIGIAMGAGGTDVALETADIALMSDRLDGVADTIQLGRRTRRKIWTNIGLSLAIKAAVLMLAVTGDATLWMAILADVGTSLVVIANGMTLLRWGGPRQQTERVTLERASAT